MTEPDHEENAAAPTENDPNPAILEDEADHEKETNGQAHERRNEARTFPKVFPDRRTF